MNDVTGDAKGMAQELCRHKVSAVSFAGNQQAKKPQRSMGKKYNIFFLPGFDFGTFWDDYMNVLGPICVEHGTLQLVIKRLHDLGIRNDDRRQMRLTYLKGPRQKVDTWILTDL